MSTALQPDFSPDYLKKGQMQCYDRNSCIRFRLFLFHAMSAVKAIFMARIHLQK